MDFSVIFVPETPKFIKIQLKISTIPQNHARFMQNFTSWRENVFLLRKSWFSGGGCFFTPPRYTSIKKSPGINRVKNQITNYQLVIYVVNYIQDKNILDFKSQNACERKSSKCQVRLYLEISWNSLVRTPYAWCGDLSACNSATAAAK